MIFDTYSSLEKLKDLVVRSKDTFETTMYNLIEEHIGSRYNINPIITKEDNSYYETVLADTDDSTIISIIQELYDERKNNKNNKKQ
jgi:hypothetical protein